MSKNIALVLSSGSSRGLAQIGAIEALEERGYQITSVAGCSIGAIIGGMYAAGKLPQLKEWFLKMDRQRMLQLTDFSVSLNHLVKGDRLLETFTEMISDVCIEDLHIPLAIVATDMTSGTEQVFTSGHLDRIIRASISIPVVLQPVRYDDMLLVDGGVTNPLPLNRVQRTEGDLLVSVNVTAPFETGEEEKKESNLPQLVSSLLEKGQRLTQLNYLSILKRITDIMLVQNTQLMLQLCPPDMAIDMPQNHFGSYDYHRADEIIAYGYQRMMQEINRYETTLIQTSLSISAEDIGHVSVKNR